MTSNTAPPGPTTARRPDLDSLYCIDEFGHRRTLHPGDVRGRYQRRKKLIWLVLFAIYLALPWIEIGGAPAVLLDIPQRHFYLFGATYNAQDFYLAFFWLTGIGFTLFVVSSMFGRIWCGYACPHTVFLEGVFRRWERIVEGSATQQKRLDDAPWTMNKVLRRSVKWAGFLGVSLFLSHTFISYFLGVDEVFVAIVSPPSEHPWAFGFVLAFTAIIYFNFAWFREQLCIVICPYGRLQGVLYDPDTINVGYDQQRGEPRGKYHAEGRGDCIDCMRCVAVCPTGIDIRNGTQLECVGCANCIDACDEVMTKLGQPTGLVRYDSQNGFEGKTRRIVRPRVFLYAFLLLVGIVVFAVAASRRTPFEAKIVRQRGSAYVLEEDRIRNSFLIHVINKQPGEVTYQIEPRAADGVEFVLPVRSLSLASFADRQLPLFVIIDRDRFTDGAKVEIVIRAGDDDGRVIDARLLGPRR